MSQYIAAVPDDGSVDSSIRSFFERFYQISDSPASHEEYAKQFTSDGKLKMASTAVQGTEAIIKMRHGMWEKVARRAHYPEKIFPFGASGNEVMIYGNVGFILKDGRGTNVQWAARASLSGSGDALKLDDYQVYMDTAAMAAAK